MVGAEAPGLVWQSVSLCALEELGAKGFKLGRDQGTQGVLPGSFLSGQPFLYPPPRHSQHCPYRWLSLPAKCWRYFKIRNLPAERGLGLGPHLLQRGQGSGKQAQGLGKQAIKAAWAIPSGHGGERAAGSQRTAKYRDTGRWKWFLPAAGGPAVPSHRSRDEAGRNGVCENELGVTGQPVANSGACRTSVWIWCQIFARGWSSDKGYPPAIITLSFQPLSIGPLFWARTCAWSSGSETLLLGANAFVGRQTCKWPTALWVNEIRTDLEHQPLSH